MSTLSKSETLYIVKEHPDISSWSPVTKEVNPLLLKMMQSRIDNRCFVYYLPTDSAEDKEVRYYKQPLGALLFIRDYCQKEAASWGLIVKQVEQLLKEVK